MGGWVRARKSGAKKGRGVEERLVGGGRFLKTVSNFKFISSILHFKKWQDIPEPRSRSRKSPVPVNFFLFSYKTVRGKQRIDAAVALRETADFQPALYQNNVMILQILSLLLDLWIQVALLVTFTAASGARNT